MADDRRVNRTRRLLQQAFIELLRERGYDRITVRDIVDRANVGRSTFYQHYKSKDELFIACHESFADSFGLWAGLFSPDPPEGLVRAFRHLREVRRALHPVFHGHVRDGGTIVRLLRESCARKIEAGLRPALADGETVRSLEVVANFLAGAQIGLVQWWLEARRTARPAEVARLLHGLQRAVIRAAFGR